MSQIAENWLSDIIEATVSWLCVVRQRTTCAMFSTPCGQRSSELVQTCLVMVLPGV